MRSRLHGSVLMAEELGYEVVGVIDNDYFVGYEHDGLKIIGTLSDLQSTESNNVTDMKDHVEFFPTKYFVSDKNSQINQTRISIIDILDKTNVKVANLISPTSNLHKLDINLGKGIHAGNNTNFSVDCEIKDYATIYMLSCISGGTVIGRNSFIGSQCFLGDNVVIGDNCIVNSVSAIGTSTINNEVITIGDNSIIGLGMVVMTSVPPNSVILPIEKNHRRIYNKLSYINNEGNK